MREQARLCGAQAVLEVELELTENEIEQSQTVVYVATGTAVELTGARRADQPRLVALKAAEYWALRNG